MPIKRILVPLDFSADSMNALGYAEEFAKLFDAELLVLYVVEPVYYATPADVYVASPNLAMLLDEQRRVGKQQLERLAAQLKQKGRRYRTLLKTGSPAQVIVDAAKSTKADLVIMATHGRTGLAHVLMGSVTEKVVRSAACPVLTVRRPAGKPTGKRKKTARAGRKR